MSDLQYCHCRILELDHPVKLLSIYFFAFLSHFQVCSLKITAGMSFSWDITKVLCKHVTNLVEGASVILLFFYASWYVFKLHIIEFYTCLKNQNLVFVMLLFELIVLTLQRYTYLHHLQIEVDKTYITLVPPYSKLVLSALHFRFFVTQPAQGSAFDWQSTSATKKSL